MSDEPINEEMERLKKRLKAKEASHWYTGKGEPAHEIEMTSKPGEFRAVNKTDAMKLDLVPSMTNLLGRYQNRSGIEKWKRGMIYDKLWENTDDLAEMLEAATEGKIEEFDTICRKLDELAMAEASQAADKGSLFHHMADILVEQFARGGSVESQIMAMNSALKKVGIKLAPWSLKRLWGLISAGLRLKSQWIVPPSAELVEREKSVVWEMVTSTCMKGIVENVPFALGGKYDLLLKLPSKGMEIEAVMSQLEVATFDRIAMLRDRSDTVNLLLDWKTRKPRRSKKAPAIAKFPSYPTDCAQLAGYAQGITMNGTRVDLVGNIFIASDMISFDPDITAANSLLHPFDDNVDLVIYSDDERSIGMRHVNAASALWIEEERQALARSQSTGGRKKKAFIPKLEVE